jgi:hypothetical protein
LTKKIKDVFPKVSIHVCDILIGRGSLATGRVQRNMVRAIKGIFRATGCGDLWFYQPFGGPQLLVRLSCEVF